MPNGDVLYYNGLNSDFPQARIAVYDSNFNQIFFRGGIRDDGFFSAGGPGPYYLAIAGNQAAAVNYSFVLHNASAAPEVAFGVDTTGTLSTGQSHVIFRFDGGAGKRLMYDGLGTNNDNVNANLYSPSASLIRSINSDLDSPILSLYDTSDHYLVIAGEVAAAADYSFRLLDVAAAPQIQFGQVTTGHLDSGRHTNLYRVTASPPGTATFDNLTLTAGAGQCNLAGDRSGEYGSRRDQRSIRSGFANPVWRRVCRSILWPPGRRRRQLHVPKHIRTNSPVTPPGLGVLE